MKDYNHEGSGNLLEAAGIDRAEAVYVFHRICRIFEESKTHSPDGVSLCFSKALESLETLAVKEAAVMRVCLLKALIATYIIVSDSGEDAFPEDECEETENRQRIIETVH